jgi:hypothetical protein
MIKQTQADLSVKSEIFNNFIISSREKTILRDLAKKVKELSSRPIEEEKKKLWYKHNALEKIRPLVFCDPEHGWTEIIKDTDLKCEGERAREWEYFLRKEIFWGEKMKDDRVIEPYFNVAHVYRESDWGMHETKIGGTDGGAYSWDAPLKDYKDMLLLHFPNIDMDYHSTERVLDLANSIFGDILNVRQKTSWWWSLGMTWTAINLRGLSQFMFDMIDYPNELHQLMSFLNNGIIAKLDFLEGNNLLFLNHEGTYVGSGGFGWTKTLPQGDISGKVRTKDMWGFAESQETVGVSPEMFAEFIFPYQLSILKRFGLNCYGCCEPIDKRWEIIKQIPNLRRVSISPWSNIELMAEKLQDKYIFSMKPSPTDLAIPDFNAEIIRKKLRNALKITKNCIVEVIMKDNHTIQNDPTRVERWVKIAREEAESI